MGTYSSRWLKLPGDWYRSPKIRMLERRENGESIVLCWIKLLGFCGDEANGGILMLDETTPYPSDVLAELLYCDADIFCTALKAFEELGLIQVDNGVITIPNWKDYQDLEKAEYKKKADAERKRAARQRAKDEAAAKAEAAAAGFAHDSDIKTEAADANPAAFPYVDEAEYQKVIALYNDICHDLPPCQRLSATRRKAIEELLHDGYTLDNLQTLFTMTAETPFLRGENERGWKADLDWLLKPENVEKVLDGKYTKWGEKSHFASQKVPNYDDIEGECF